MDIRKVQLEIRALVWEALGAFKGPESILINPPVWLEELALAVRASDERRRGLLRLVLRTLGVFPPTGAPEYIDDLLFEIMRRCPPSLTPVEAEIKEIVKITIDTLLKKVCSP